MPDLRFADFNFSATPDDFKGEHREAEDVRLLIVDANHGTIKEDSFVNLGHYLGDNDVLAVNDVGMGPSRLLGVASPSHKIDICFLMLQDPSRSNRLWDVVILSETPPPTQGHFSLNNGAITGRLLGKTLDFDGPYWIEKDKYIGYRGLVEIDQDPSQLAKQLNNHGLLMHPWYSDLNKLPTRSLNPHTTTINNAVHVSEPARRITSDMYKSFYGRGMTELQFSLWMCFSWRQATAETRLNEYRMNFEEYTIGEIGSNTLRDAMQNRRNIVSIGTSGSRVLESLTSPNPATAERTDLFISPGFKFKYTRSLLTNLHNPSGTHVIMAAAYGGRDLIIEACETAVKKRMKFGIHGDSMLVLGAHEPTEWAPA